MKIHLLYLAGVCNNDSFFSKKVENLVCNDNAKELANHGFLNYDTFWYFFKEVAKNLTFTISINSKTLKIERIEILNEIFGYPSLLLNQTCFEKAINCIDDLICCGILKNSSKEEPKATEKKEIDFSTVNLDLRDFKNTLDQIQDCIKNPKPIKTDAMTNAEMVHNMSLEGLHALLGGLMGLKTSEQEKALFDWLNLPAICCKNCVKVCKCKVDDNTGVCGNFQNLNIGELSECRNVLEKPKAENIELKKRLKKAVELPCRFGDTIYIPW